MSFISEKFKKETETLFSNVSSIDKTLTKLYVLEKKEASAEDKERKKKDKERRREAQEDKRKDADKNRLKKIVGKKEKKEAKKGLMETLKDAFGPIMGVLGSVGGMLTSALAGLGLGGMLTAALAAMGPILIGALAGLAAWAAWQARDEIGKLLGGRGDKVEDQLTNFADDNRSQVSELLTGVKISDSRRLMNQEQHVLSDAATEATNAYRSSTYSGSGATKEEQEELKVKAEEATTKYSEHREVLDRVVVRDNMVGQLDRIETSLAREDKDVPWYEHLGDIEGWRKRNEKNRSNLLTNIKASNQMILDNRKLLKELGIDAEKLASQFTTETGDVTLEQGQQFESRSDSTTGAVIQRGAVTNTDYLNPQALQSGGFVVPGHGNGDQFHTQLPAGSFVLNRKAVAAGQSMGYFQQGGAPQMQNVVLEPGEIVLGPGQWGKEHEKLNNDFKRFQTGGTITNIYQGGGTQYGNTTNNNVVNTSNRYLQGGVTNSTSGLTTTNTHYQQGGDTANTNYYQQGGVTTTNNQYQQGGVTTNSNNYYQQGGVTANTLSNIINGVTTNTVNNNNSTNTNNRYQQGGATNVSNVTNATHGITNNSVTNTRYQQGGVTNGVTNNSVVNTSNRYQQGGATTNISNVTNSTNGVTNNNVTTTRYQQGDTTTNNLANITNGVTNNTSTNTSSHYQQGGATNVSNVSNNTSSHYQQGGATSISNVSNNTSNRYQQGGATNVSNVSNNTSNRYQQGGATNVSNVSNNTSNRYQQGGATNVLTNQKHTGIHIQPLRYQEGGTTPGTDVILEPGEMVFPQATPTLLALNDNFERFQAGGLIEHVHGDPTRAGYDKAGHGMESNAHDHMAFSSPELRKAVQKDLAAGKGPSGRKWEIGSTTGGRHSANSYHYSGQAFDIPWSQFGGGKVGPADFKQSQQLYKDVKAIVKTHGGSVTIDGDNRQFETGEMDPAMGKQDVNAGSDVGSLLNVGGITSFTSTFLSEIGSFLKEQITGTGQVSSSVKPSAQSETTGAEIIEQSHTAQDDSGSSEPIIVDLGAGGDEGTVTSSPSLHTMPPDLPDGPSSSMAADYFFNVNIGGV